jgi:hypothetical protein
VGEAIAGVNAVGAALAGLSGADASGAACAPHGIAIAPAKITPAKALSRASCNRRFIASLPTSFLTTAALL